MSCRALRDRLVREPGRPAGRDRAHLETCAACRRFAARLAGVEALLAEPSEPILPDAGFAARVAARLPAEPRDELARAALRMLPAAVALAAVLGGWCLLATPGPGSLFEESPTDDLLAWAIDEDESTGSGQSADDGGGDTR